MKRHVFLLLLLASGFPSDGQEVYDLTDGRSVISGQYHFPPHPPRPAIFDPAVGEIRFSDHRSLKNATLSSAVHNEEVVFRGFRGRLSLPNAQGPHPAVVMIHGSGPATRDFAYFGLMAGHLANQGLAVLTYDKRSDWKTASVVDLAGDTAAAIDYLRSRTDIDPRRIGAFGHSQGGWIAPLVANRRDAAFICVLAAPAISTTDQELDETESELRARGFDDASIRDALSAVKAMNRVIVTGKGKSELARLIAKARKQPWGPHADLTDDPATLARVRRNYYDPRPALQALKAPVLAVFGGADTVVPAAKNESLWRAYVRSPLETFIVPGANHGLYVQQGHAHAHGEQQDGYQFASGFIPRLTRWLVAAAGLKTLPSISAEELSGAYSTTDGGVIALSPFGSMIMMVDFPRGRTAGFAPPSAFDQDIAVVGHGMAPTPVRIAVLEGTVPTLRVREMGRPERVARRLALREEEVSFVSGDVSLAGTFLTPPAPGPHPAVIFVHGSGPATRLGFLAWARLFAARGIAALAFDKRGTGSSGGDFRSADYDQLSDDLAAAVSFLRDRSEIAPRRIGFIGTSQGAWVAPLTAAKSGDIAFIIASSGGPLGPAAQERYRRLQKVHAAGYARADQSAAGEILDAYFGWLTQKIDQATVAMLWAKYSSQPWFKLLEVPSAAPTEATLSPVLRAFGRELRFDAAAAFQRFDGPVLVLLGEKDDVFPIHKVMAAARDVVPQDRLTIQVFEGANHGLQLPAEQGDVPRVVPGYFETMLGWAKEHLTPIRQ